VAATARLPSSSRRQQQGEINVRALKSSTEFAVRVYCAGDFLSVVYCCCFVVGFVSMCFVCNLKFGTVIHMALKD
jgi:hypothetical protein